MIPMNHSIDIQQLVSGQWVPVTHCHAAINKTQPRTEQERGGALQSQYRLSFVVRYSRKLAQICTATQDFRILYFGRVYKIEDYDDFKEQHRTITLTGVSYHGR